jgi:hypothetical protein
MVETKGRIDSHTSKKGKHYIAERKTTKQCSTHHWTEAKDLKQSLILSLINIRDKIAIQKKSQPWWCAYWQDNRYHGNETDLKTTRISVVTN